MSYHTQDRQTASPTAEHRELHSTSCDRPQWKRVKKKYIVIPITESLSCTAEINTTLQINNAPNKNEIKGLRKKKKDLFHGGRSTEVTRFKL